MPAAGISGRAASMPQMYLQALAEHYGFSLDTPVEELPKDVVDMLLYGTKGEKIKMSVQTGVRHAAPMHAPFEGIVTNLERRYRETSSDCMKEEYETYMSARSLPGVPRASG